MSVCANSSLMDSISDRADARLQSMPVFSLCPHPQAALLHQYLHDTPPTTPKGTDGDSRRSNKDFEIAFSYMKEDYNSR